MDKHNARATGSARSVPTPGAGSRASAPAATDAVHGAQQRAHARSPKPEGAAGEDTEHEAAQQVADLMRLHALGVRLIASSGASQDVLDDVLAAVVELQGGDFGTILLCDPERGDLALAACVGFSPEVCELLARVPAGVGPCGTALVERRRVIAEDVAADPVFPFRAAAELAGFRAVYSTPLFTTGGEVLGTLATYFAAPHRPSAREIRLVELYVQLAAGAIAQARLGDAQRAALVEAQAARAAAEAEIAERERAEEAYLESEARFGAIFNQAGSGVVQADATGRMVLVNRRWCEMLGYTEAELLQMNIADVTHPASLAPTLAAVGRLAAGGPDFVIEKNYVRRDGSLLPASSDVRALRGPDGTYRGLVAVVLDITERLRSEQALQESEERFRATFAHARTGLALTDLRGRFVQVNAAYTLLTGYSEHELYATDLLSLTHPEDRARNAEQIEQLLAGKIPGFVVEKRYVRKDGGIVWVQNSVFLARDSQGHPREIGAVVEDITERKRAEDALRASEGALRREQERLTITLAASETGTFRWNPYTDEFLDFDTNLKRLFGFAPDHPVRVTADFTARVHPDDVAALISAVDACRAGADFDMEYRVVLPDGQVRWLSHRAKMERDATGQPTYLVGACTDITERKQAEEALAERLSQLEATFDTMVDGVAVYDSAGRIVRLNAALRQMLSLDPAYVMRAVGERVPRLRLRDGSGRPLLPEQTPPARVVRGEVFTGSESMDMRAQTLDGREVEMNVSGAPVHDADGHIVGGVCVYHDVTEHRRVEAAVRASEEKFRTLAENMPTLAWMARPDGSIFWYNPRWYSYTGTTPESQEGWGWQSVHDPKELPRVMERWLHSLASGEPFEMVFPLRGADGVFRPFLTRITPVKDERGQVTGWFGANTDVSDLRAAEEALRAVNLRLDEFLRTATHELKTPLAALNANLQLTERRLQRLHAAPSDTPKPPRAGEAFQAPAQLIARSQQQVRRLTRLVDDLVDAARIQAGKLEIQPAPCDLAEIVWEAVIEQRAVRPERTLVFQYAAPQGPGVPVPVEVDADRIGQVVTNYLTNALKYSPNGSPVEVVLRVEAGSARVWVRDEGPGIPPEEQARVWERGHRVAGIESTGDGVGLGLGLHISREIIERHGGTVGVESTPGEGSTFWFTLPLAKPLATSADADAEARG